MLKNKAFTLTEILLALGILGIITGAVATQLQKMEADSIKIAFQNCYSQMTSIISEMYSDETIYPKIPLDGVKDDGQTRYMGFCNGYDYTTSGSEDAHPSEKFNREFLKRMGNDVNNVYQTDSYDYTQFSAKNNSEWYISGYVFSNDECPSWNSGSSSKYDLYTVITIDVNGQNKGPNCPYSGSMSGTGFTTTTSSCLKPDTFKFFIYPDAEIGFDNQGYYNGTNLETYLANNHYLDSNRTD